MPSAHPFSTTSTRATDPFDALAGIRLPAGELALFRVGRESINNAVKHAKATSVEILLSKEVNSLVLKVRDNGLGFAPSSQGNSGLGLSQMRERVVQLNGALDISSTPGHGTTVVARIPLGLIQ